MERDDGILWDVVEEHLDESEFLWMLWERGLDSPSSTPAELAGGTEARLFAHMQGLTLAAPAVVEKLLRPALHDYQRDRAAAASWAWLSTGDPKALPELCGPILRECDPPERRGVVRALGLWEGDFQALLAAALAEADRGVQAAALTIMAAHGWSPGPAVAELAGSRDKEVLAACVEFAVPAAMAAALAGELGEPVFDRALRAGLMRHVPEAWAAAQARIDRRGAAAAVGSLGGEQGVAMLMGALAGSHRASALYGLGFTGRRAAADACAARLDDVECGAVAAEAFAAITGFDRETARVERARPEEAEEDEAEFPVEDADAGLVWVDAETVREWWQVERRRFEPGRRYLFGAPATVEGMIEAFERTTMRRRHWLALELAVRTGGRVKVDTRAWVERQRRALAGLRGLRGELERASGERQILRLG